MSISVKTFFLVKKSKFRLRSPPEDPETPETDCNTPHWRPLNDLRWVRDILFWPRTFFCIYMLLNVYIGQLVKIFRGVGLYLHYTVYIYKKKFLTETKCLKIISNHSMVVSGPYINPFQGSKGASGGLRSQNFDFLTQNFKMAVFARFHFLKSKNPISGHN